MHQRGAVHQRVVDVEERRRGQVGWRCRRARRGAQFQQPLRSDLGAGFPGELLLRAVRVVVADLALSGSGHGYNIRSPDGDTDGVDRQVELLTRDGCPMCLAAATRLAELAAELGFVLEVTDVDVAAAAGESARRAEFGDRLPVVLLDGAEHSYWEVDEARLRADLAR